MSTDYLVVASFDFVDDAINAVKVMRKENRDFQVYSPVPYHDLEDVVYEGKRRSPVRMFTLLGGLTGCLGAFLFTTWMSIDYPIRVSAKPLVSIPAFVVIAFECTILLGAIFTLLSMFHFSRLPNLFFDAGFRGTFTEATFGLAARCAKEECEQLSQQLSQLGAQKVEVQYAR